MASIQREVGGWWRCSRYVVVDGFIRPADDALLERYDPWEAYRVSRDEKEGLPPYQTLFTLLRQLNFDEKRQLKPESESALEAWCNKNGLLGILPQRFSLISQRGPTGKDGLPTFERSHVRKGAEWTTLPVAAGSLGALELDPRASLVHIEPDPAWGPLGEFARVYPEIFRSEASPPATEFGPIWRGLEVLARYFPGIPEEYVGSLELPAPLSQKFWREYGERVADFVGFAERLQSAIYYLTDTPLETALEHGQVTMSPEMVLSTGSGYDFWRGVRIINALLASSAPHLVITPDMTLSYAWSFPSLVSSFAMMIVQDIIEDRRVRSCDTCGVFFLSSSPRAKYCSPRCRNTAEKRRHRARKKSLANEEGRP